MGGGRAPPDVAHIWVPRIPQARRWKEGLQANGPWDCKCQGFGPHRENLEIGRAGEPDRPGEPFWDYLLHQDLFAATQPSVTYLGGKRDFLVASGLLSYTMTHVKEAVWDCPLGTATIMLLGLTVMEETVGLDSAREFLASALALTLHARSFPCAHRFALADPTFSGNLLVPNFGALPKLLRLADDKGLPQQWRPPGEETDGQKASSGGSGGNDAGNSPSWRTAGSSSLLRCDPFAPKIFVHEVEQRWVSPLIGCADGLAATEVWVHQQLLQSDCRTLRFEDADLLYVPIYARCLYARKHAVFEKGYSWEHPFTNATEWYAELLGRQLRPAFALRPQDHIFLFPEERWPLPEVEVLPRTGRLGRSVVLSPEARPLDCDSRHERIVGYACVHVAPRQEGVLVIPSFVDSWRVTRLRSWNLPLSERYVLASFMGLGVEKAYSITENWRHLLRPLGGLPGFQVGDYATNYGEVMGRSIFCLVPKGVGTWSHRLYEALLAGCIPVILSDLVQLPFPFLPWGNFSLKWPMRKVDGKILPEYLRRLAGTPVVSSLKDGVDRHACWFDYHSDEEECNPLVGLTRQLRNPRGEKRDPLGEPSPLFWGGQGKAWTSWSDGWVS